MKPFAKGITIVDQYSCGPNPDYVEACCGPDPEYNSPKLCLKYTRDDCLARGGVPQGLGSECPAPEDPENPLSYCLKSCSSSADCELAEFCQKPTGQCNQTGNCMKKTETCPQIYDPVCGCDGITYPNACQADIAGIAIDFNGECNLN
jgi:hypothetical protein